jgi:hypothetical protein
MSRRIIDIRIDGQLRATDPDLLSEAHRRSQPEAAPLTRGPNRFTIRVPSHGTKLSLGEGDLTDAALWNKRPGVGTEAGIVAQTDLHAHLHTFGAGDPEAKTVVRLGVPTQSVPTSTDYQPGEGAGIGTLGAGAFSGWSGYAMVTQGAAYQEARQNYVITSAEGEVRVASATRISLGTSGDVLIGADADLSPADISANDGDPRSPTEAGRADALFRAEGAAPLAAQAEGIVRGFATMAAAIAKSITAKPILSASGWTAPVKSALADSSASASMLFANAGLLTAQLALPRSPGGQVGVYASRVAAVSSPQTVAVNAGAAASVVGGVSASVLGGVAANLAGLVSATVTGLAAAVSGQISATLESVFGPAEVRSPAGVNIYAQSGPVTVTANRSVQVSSVSGGAHVHGASQCYIGAGAAAGMGLYALPSALFVGNLASAGAFASPGPDASRGVSVAPASITISMAPSILEMTPRSTSIAASSVTVTGAETATLGGAVTFVTGGAVYLG